MKCWPLFALALITGNVFAAGLTCIYDEGGQDEEIITAKTRNGKVQSMNYVTFQGTLDPFLEQSENLFMHTKDDLIIKIFVRFAKDLKKADLTVLSKEDNTQLASQTFKCQ